MEAVADRSALKTRLAILHQTKPKTLELKAEIFEIQRTLRRLRPKPSGYEKAARAAPSPSAPKRPAIKPPPPIRTNRDRFQVLQRHLAYLKNKAEGADLSDPYLPWVVEEAKALEWAMEIVADRIEVTP